MTVLFLFSRHSENEKDSTLTKDLSDEFSRQGHNVIVVTMLEKKYGRKTELKIENGYKVLRVRTGNYFDDVEKFEKGMTTLTMVGQFKKAILKYFGNEEIDLIYTHTPFISNPSLIKPLKKHFSCFAMLHYWDIFPQNAIDLKLLKNKFLIKYFEKKEREIYRTYDYIGCMSQGNIDYILGNRKKIEINKFFLLKNWAKLKEKENIRREEIRGKYNLKLNDFVAVFGGNMGKPQKLENILFLAEELKEIKNIKFIFIGKGTEKAKLENLKEDRGIKNTIFFDYILREDYEKLIGACDIGIVSLDESFTVPNFPSKTTDYFKLNLPIFASLDSCAESDYGIFLEKKIQAGLFARAGNLVDMKKKFLKLYNDEKLRVEMGKNGRKYYEDNLGVERAYKTIIEKLGENKYV